MDKRTKIIEAAAACFLRNGFAETSLDLIAVESGVVKQTIYNYFENKDAVFKASIEHLLAGTKTGFDSAWYKLSAQEFFQKIGKALLTVLSEPQTTAFLRLLVKECRRFPELQQIYAEHIPRPFIEFVMGYIEANASDKKAIAEARQIVQASSWYFRAALTGFATLSNLAPLLKYSLPVRSKFLNVLSELFSRYLELQNERNWKSAAMPTALAAARVAVDESSATIKEFLVPELGNLGAKKLAIIEGAIRVFSQRGFAEASMDDIAEAANVSKQTLYKHFRNKNLLYGFIARSVIEQLQTQSLPSGDLSLPDYISGYCSTAVARARLPWIREFFRLVFGESQVFPLESGTFLIYIMDHGREQLEAKIQRTFPEEIDNLSVSIALRSIIGGFILLGQIYVLGDNPFLTEDTLESLNRDLIYCMR